jgi:hypothetical protein
VIFGGAIAAILVVTVPIGLLSSAGVNRAVSLGFYIVGAFLVVLGFLGGSRGPLRSANDYTHDTALERGRRLRRATPDERQDSMNSAALMIAIGLVLVALGVIIDSRFTLV